MNTCMQPRAFASCAGFQRRVVPAARTCRLPQLGRPAADAAVRTCTAARQRQTACRAEGGDGGSEPEEQQRTNLPAEISKKTEETVGEGEKTLGFVGNLIMWTLLSFLLAASLFFTTARSFLPNDMQPLDEGIASNMR